MRKSYSKKSVIYNESITLQIDNRNFFNSKNRRKKKSPFLYMPFKELILSEENLPGMRIHISQILGKEMFSKNREYFDSSPYLFPNRINGSFRTCGQLNIFYSVLILFRTCF